MFLIARSAKFARLFFIICFCGLLTYITLAFYTFHLAFSTMKRTNIIQYKLKRYPVPKVAIDLETIQLKYILLWTTSDSKHNLSAEGEKIFFDNDCSHLNCYITTNKSFLGNVTKFYAIVFDISALKKWKKNLPKQRSEKQKYVLYARVPAKEYPICNIRADNYFNWTWTYKLHSDIPAPFIEIKDLKGNLIAPSLTVEWPENLTKTINSLAPDKVKSIMWHNEYCNNDNAKAFAKALQKHLPEHSMDMDIYGCDHEKCPSGGCEQLVENYYFYLAFENSMSDDYVTKEVLKGYDHDTVPVVVGGADYGRFLPPGSYINARNDSPETLASLLGYIARNPITYNKYYSWKEHYTITEANIQKGFCQLCDLLNDKQRTDTRSSYESLRKWWYNGNLRYKCYPKGSETFDDVLSYIPDPGIRKKTILG